MALKDYYTSPYKSRNDDLLRLIEINNQWLAYEVFKCFKKINSIKKHHRDRGRNSEYSKKCYQYFKEAIEPFRQIGWQPIYFTARSTYLGKNISNNTGDYIKTNAILFNTDDYFEESCCTSSNDSEMSSTAGNYAPILINKYSGECFIVKYAFVGTSEIKVITLKAKQFVNSFENLYYIREINPMHDRYNFKLDDMLSYLYGINVTGFESKFKKFSKLNKFYHNAFEELLRYSENCLWLIDVFSVVENGKTKVETSLKDFFGLTKHEMKYFFSKPNENEFMFHLAVRRYSNCSYIESANLYKKVCEITEKYDLNAEFKNTSRSRVRGKHGKIIATSENLPHILVSYINNGYSKYFSVSTYINYLIQEKKKNSSLTIEEIQMNLADYNRMASIVLGKKNFILPYNIIKAHDSMVTNFNEIMKDKESDQQDETVYRLNLRYNDAIEYFEDDTYLMIRPYYPNDLYSEGAELNHCVGSYVTNILSGHCRIFFLRKKFQMNHPLMTVELIEKDGKKYIGQFQGKGRRRPLPEEEKFAQNWLIHLTEENIRWDNLPQDQKIKSYRDKAINQFMANYNQKIKEKKRIKAK